MKNKNFLLKNNAESSLLLMGLPSGGVRVEIDCLLDGKSGALGATICWQISRDDMRDLRDYLNDLLVEEASK